jgi:adenylate cyclase
MRWWARSRLRTKIFLAFSALIFTVLIVTVWLTQLVISHQIQSALRQDLFTTGQVFQGLLKERAARLTTNSTLLAGDYALRRAVAEAREKLDPETVASVALNYQQRIGVGLLWITDEEGILLADSEGRRQYGESLASTFPLVGAIAASEAATAIAEIQGVLFQLIAVPVLGPDVIGFLVLGQSIDDTLARQLQKDTGSEISFLTQMRLFASSWPSATKQVLFPHGQIPLEGFWHRAEQPFLYTFASERFLSLLVPIDAHVEPPLFALIQQSYDEALAPLYALRRRLIGIGGGAILLALFVGIGLASGVTAPIQSLVTGMQGILRGNLVQRLPSTREDEIGFLAQSFNTMAEGLEEKEKIRDLLDKVVSPEIAHELLQRGVALGGEMREVTVLFADIRGFTSLSEQLPPADLVRELNAYFGRVSRVIEGQKGVIDKYIGDEIMAIFGAPFPSDEHAVRAVTAAIEMLHELQHFNRAGERRHPWRIGIGIATGPVVAGNVGSPDRLSYTVLGDTVNIASRLQGLTKEYGVPMIVSGETYEHVAASFPCRLLGQVAVRGRTQKTALYTVEVEGRV